MKPWLEFLCSLIIMVILGGCSVLDPGPKPTVAFDYVVTGTGSVVFTNKTTNAKSYHWDFGDGHSSSEASPVHIYADNKTYEVTLQATSSGGSNSLTQSVVVQGVTGNIMFWTDTNLKGQIAISIDNVYKGTITLFYSGGTPSCGNTTAGCVFIKLPPGTYTVHAISAVNTTWDFGVIIHANVCNAQVID